MVSKSEICTPREFTNQFAKSMYLTHINATINKVSKLKKLKTNVKTSM